MKDIPKQSVFNSRKNSGADHLSFIQPLLNYWCISPSLHAENMSLPGLSNGLNAYCVTLMTEATTPESSLTHGQLLQQNKNNLFLFANAFALASLTDDQNWPSYFPNKGYVPQVVAITDEDNSVRYLNIDRWKPEVSMRNDADQNDVGVHELL